MQQVEEDTVIKYDEFINEITVLIKKMMGEAFTVRIITVTKNNSLELDSLVMQKEGQNFAPNIYLLQYYEFYIQGTPIKELAERICGIYRSCKASVVDEKFKYAYEDMKPNIIYRLVSYERNRKLLDKIPHIRYLDLAITYHCLVRDDMDGIGTIRITNEHINNWKISHQELQLHAVENTMKLFPPSIRSMEDVLLGMLKEESMLQLGESLPEEFQKQFYEEESTANKHKMYILSNLKGINGATCLLYNNILKDFAASINSDFYILPSSIHEVILVPYDKSFTKESLAEMVRDVNFTQVACDEVLSDQVYYFSRKNNAIVF